MKNSAKKRRDARLNAEETALFCEQAAMVLKSGLALTDGLRALCEDFRDAHFGSAITALGAAISQTGSLARALDAVPVFPRYAMRMITIGEEAGKLDDVLQNLGDYYAREAQVRKNLRQAVFYPALLTLLMGVVIGVLVFRVLPVFQQVFNTLGKTLTATTRHVVSAGVGIGTLAMILTGLLLLVGLFLAALMRTKYRAPVENMLYTRVPIVRNVINTMEAERFAAAMAMLLESGYPIQDALKMVQTLSGTDKMRGKTQKVYQLMVQGESFSAAVENARIFETLHARMLRAGAMAGQTDAVLFSLRTIYRQKLDRDILTAESLIEPVLVTLLSVIAGAILLSVMLPLAGILSSML